MARTIHPEPVMPPAIAQAIKHAEEQIEFLRRIGTMEPGDSHELTVAALRPIASVLGLEPQPEQLRGEMRLTLHRTPDGWRVM